MAKVIPAKMAEITEVKGEAEILISQAIKSSASVETMERLLAMRRQLKEEWAKEQYDKAMAKLQSELPIIEKKQTAGSSNFSYKYAPLEYIIEKTKKVISGNGFSYYFDTSEEDIFMTIYCYTTHEAGHMKTSKFKLPIDKGGRMNATQQYGSALTYGKRYCFCNAFGIVVGGEDTDAQNTKADGKVIADTPKITEAQADKVMALLQVKDKTIDDLNHAIDFAFKKSSLQDLTQFEAEKLLVKLNSLPNKDEIIDIDEVDDGIEKQKAQGV